MNIDGYRPCPCQSGKKIKFCCGKDLTHELTEVLTLAAGRQLLAARDEIERVIAKSGERDCLAALQVHVLIRLDQLDEAERVNDRFIRRNPQNALGHLHRARIFLAQQEIALAVEALQDAVDCSPGDEVPVLLAQQFLELGVYLLQAGFPHAARAHLVYADYLSDSSDERIRQILIESYRMPWPELLLRDDPTFKPVDSSAPWAKNFNVAVGLTQQGQFRKALKVYEALIAAHGENPELLHAAAIAQTLLADITKISASWRALADHPDTDFWQAMEAELLAQHYQLEAFSEVMPLMDVTTAVTSTSDLTEHLTEHERYFRIPVDNEEEVDGPPPVAAYLFLSGSRDFDPAQADLEKAPNIMGQVTVFPKQTDQEARAVLQTVRDDKFDEVCQSWRESLAQFASGELQQAESGSYELLDQRMHRQIFLPRDLDPAARQACRDELHREIVLEDCLSCPLKFLDNQTALQASQEPKYQARLAAFATRLKNSRPLDGNEKLFGELWAKLGLPEPTLIDPTDLDVTEITPYQWQRIDCEKLDDESLLRGYTDLSLSSNFAAIRRLAPVILTRPHLDQEGRFIRVLNILARVSQETSEAIDYVTRATRMAVEKELPVGMQLVHELEIRLERGVTERISELLKTIKARHMQEPDVEMMLFQTLARFGIIRPDGTPAGGPHNVDETEDKPGAIWTPESESAMASDSAEPGSEPSKLWVPGMD